VSKSRQWSCAARRFVFTVALIAACLGCGRKPKQGAAGSTVRPRIAVALSGGGYRATLHGLAALRALHSLGLLDDADIVSGVSGGSVVAAYYGYARARSSKAAAEFDFQRFEDELLELVCSTAVDVAAKCAIDSVSAVATGDFDERVGACVRDPLAGFSTPALPRAIEEFSGACPTADAVASWRRRCEEGGFRSLGGMLAQWTVEAALGTDVGRSVQDTMCFLAARYCSNPGRRDDSGHLFSDFLRLTLFRPTEGRDPRMSDLAGVKLASGTSLTVLLNASSNTNGDPWYATPVVAGFWRRPGADRQYGDSDAPRPGRGPAVADVVAASACHPLFCRPVTTAAGQSAGEALIDGGVFDNLGVEAILHTIRGSDDRRLIVIVDARAPQPTASVTPSRLDTVLRVHGMLVNQRSDGVADHATAWAADGRKRREVLRIRLSQNLEAREIASMPTDFSPVSSANRELVSRLAGPVADALRKSMAGSWASSAPAR
jgi:predicted acylesterase/phospholipase RssA